MDTNYSAAVLTGEEVCKSFSRSPNVQFRRPPLIIFNLMTIHSLSEKIGNPDAMSNPDSLNKPARLR